MRVEGHTVTHRIAVGVATFAASLLVASGVFAQSDDLGGTIVHVDPGANTITFSDGRIVHYDPLWRVLVNGQEVARTEVPPGSVIALASPGTSTRAVVAGAPQPAMAQASSFPYRTTVGDTGTVDSIDQVAKTITLKDGRVLKATDVQVWRQETLTSLQPGAAVYVTDVLPSPGPARVAAATSTSTRGWTSNDPEMKGRVSSVDHTGGRILLSDGRTVFVAPATRVQTMNAQTVTVNELRSGDEAVIQVQQVIPVAGPEPLTTAGPAHDVVVGPSYRFPGSAMVAADRVVIVRYPEAL